MYREEWLVHERIVGAGEGESEVSAGWGELGVEDLSVSIDVPHVSGIRPRLIVVVEGLRGFDFRNLAQFTSAGGVGSVEFVVPVVEMIVAKWQAWCDPGGTEPDAQLRVRVSTA